jgi:hypothetical protein
MGVKMGAAQNTPRASRIHENFLRFSPKPLVEKGSAETKRRGGSARTVARADQDHFSKNICSGRNRVTEAMVYIQLSDSLPFTAPG